MEPVFTAFATAAFFEFALFAVFEMRYLLHAWRARRDPGQDVWAQQRELSVLYARFYGALLGGVFLSFQLRRWGFSPPLGTPCSTAAAARDVGSGRRGVTLGRMLHECVACCVATSGFLPSCGECCAG